MLYAHFQPHNAIRTGSAAMIIDNKENHHVVGVGFTAYAINVNIGVSNYLKNILIKNGVLDNNNDKLCGTAVSYTHLHEQVAVLLLQEIGFRLELAAQTATTEHRHFVGFALLVDCLLYTSSR